MGAGISALCPRGSGVVPGCLCSLCGLWVKILPNIHERCRPCPMCDMGRGTWMVKKLITWKLKRIFCHVLAVLVLNPGIWTLRFSSGNKPMLVSEIDRHQNYNSRSLSGMTIHLYASTRDRCHKVNILDWTKSTLGNGYFKHESVISQWIVTNYNDFR